MRFSLPHAWTGPTFAYPSPRDWQARALPVAVEALESGSASIVRAIMGSGKAAFAGELVYTCVPEPGEVVVVSAPSRSLVDQLSETIGERIGSEYVGRYYTDAKQADRPVIVACLDSLPSLSEELEAAGRSVALWIADECHRTETETVSAFLERSRPARRIGLTATPYLANGGLSIWSELAFSYGVEEALRDRVIVPWRVEGWTGGEVATDIAALQMAERGKSIGPGVINATTIEDAENFARLAHEYGLNVRTVHSARRKAENADALERLEAGELDAVIHVSMLQEGVDLPWLRWILLRRNTQSRVRFAQEVGRVLRASPGKEFATIFDPLDLFGTYKITLEAVLSGGSSEKVVEERESVEESADEIFEIFSEELEFEDPEERMAAALEPIEAYLRRVVVTLDAAGIVSQKVASRSMRRDAPTLKQVEFARRLYRVPTPKLVEGLPERHAELLLFCVREAGRWNKGTLSDLISILVGLRKAKRWPDIVESTL